MRLNKAIYFLHERINETFYAFPSLFVTDKQLYWLTGYCYHMLNFKMFINRIKNKVCVE